MWLGGGGASKAMLADKVITSPKGHYHFLALEKSDKHKKFTASFHT